MRIALDAMGGDFAPEPNVEGAVAALDAHPDLEIALVGDVARLERLITHAGSANRRLTVVGAEGWVGMEEKPTEALRKKPNCSITVCWRMMAAKEVDAVISAGHTGAVVAAGLRTKLFLKGVKRPGIAVALPTLRGKSVLMDVGANPGARAEHIYQYGIMGSIYARELLGIAHPRVAVMNIGSEDGKGTDVVRDAHSILVNSPIRDRYIGNVEGRGLYLGEADVILCEGFVGNVILKVSEGMADMLMRTVPAEVLPQLSADRSAAEAAFRNMARRYAYNEEGGAPLLGIDGICIICHGSSDSRAIFNAIRSALRFSDRAINSQIVNDLASP
jgi:glycerol-3-phosphate acyltransferase PlsX